MILAMLMPLSHDGDDDAGGISGRTVVLVVVVMQVGLAVCARGAISAWPLKAIIGSTGLTFGMGRA